MAPGSEAGSHSDISGYPVVDVNGYPVKTRMKHVAGPGLLIDTGSPTNLLSRPWIEEQVDACIAAGVPLPVAQWRNTPLNIGGVGNGCNRADKDIDCTIGIDSLFHGPTLAKFKGPDLRGTSLPGIIGQRTLKENRCLIDCFNLELYICGPGGFDIKLSPGTDKFKLEESADGHLLLPCGVFPNDARGKEPTVDLSCRTFAALFKDSKTKGATTKPRMSKE